MKHSNNSNWKKKIAKNPNWPQASYLQALPRIWTQGYCKTNWGSGQNPNWTEDPGLGVWRSDHSPPCLLTNCHSFSNIVEAEVTITNSFSIGGHILFHLVPLRVPKCLLNDVKQTSCDHAHQDSAKRKRNLENQLFKLLLKIVENKDCLLLHYIAKNQIQACTFSFLLSHNTLMLHDISIP